MVNALYLQESTLCLSFQKLPTSKLLFFKPNGNTFYWQSMLNPQRCGLIKQQNTLELNGQNHFTNLFLPPFAVIYRCQHAFAVS